MSVGSISSNPLAASLYSSVPSSEDRKAEEAPAKGPSIADHVAAADDHAPVRSFNATVGTLVDTYL
jgi:predicted cobalt transporter CbtA